MSAFLHDLFNIFQHPYVALIFLSALAFDYVNGFHDAANSIATIVSTRVLRPFQAVCWAAWWNFAAAWFFEAQIANSVAKWVHPEFVTLDVIFAGLLGAIIWDLITWYIGLPISSSHALLGGFGGAAITHAAKWGGVLHTAKVVAAVEFIVLAPLIGLALGLFFMILLLWALRRVTPMKVNRWFRIVQLGSAAAYSLGHGTNDAQKTMGIIAALLYTSIWQHDQASFAAGNVEFPFWIVFVCHLAIALGTLTGGWWIVKTMDMKIAKLSPHSATCAETAAAVSLFLSAGMGVPVSTTHTIIGAIVGVGSVHRLSAVRWGVTRSVFWAWVLTIPCSAIIAAGAYKLIKLLS
jgi:PiT family inorganic phosphate transporter